MKKFDIKKKQKKSRKILFLVVTVIIFFIVAFASVIIRYIRSYDDEQHLQSKYGFIALDEVK